MLQEDLGGSVFSKRQRAYLDDFALYQLEELKRAPRTVRTYRFSLNCLIDFAGKSIEKLGTADLRRFKRESQYKPSTNQGIVVAAHQFGKWMVVEGEWGVNPFAEVPVPRVAQDPKAPCSTESARKLLEACETPLDYRLVYLALLGGLRIHECALVSSDHVQGKRLVFRGKGSKKRTVPLHQEVRRNLHRILDKQPSSDQVLQSNMRRLRERTGVTDVEGHPVTAHTLRRTFATSLYERHRVPYEVVAKLLGHGADVTARYVRIPMERLEDAIRLLDYYEGEPTQLTLW